MATTDEPPLQQVAAKAAGRRGGRLLCVQKIDRFGGQWEIPGGRLDSGEDHRSALRRELREELGWDQAAVGDLLECGPADPLPPFPPMFYLLVAVADLGREPVLSDEHQRYDWLTAGAVARLGQNGMFNPSLARMLDSILAAA